MISSFKTRQKGAVILEALLAFLVLAVGIGALLFLQGDLMRGSSLTKARAEAMELAKDRMELWRNYVEKNQYSAGPSKPTANIGGVNATYTVDYCINDDCSATFISSPNVENKLEVKVSWPGVEVHNDGTPVLESVSLESNLFFIDPSLIVAIAARDDSGGEAAFPLVSPFITGVEGKHPSTVVLGDTSPDDITIKDPTPDADADPENIEIKRYISTGGGGQVRSNVEVIHGVILNADGNPILDENGEEIPNVVLTSFGGIVHRIKGKIITDRFSVPLDSDNDGTLSGSELRNFWIDDGGADGIGTVGKIEEDEVKYWLDANGDGVIQDTDEYTEYTYWVDDSNPIPDGEVQTSEFSPPEATARANSILVLPRVCDDMTYSESHPDECDQSKLLKVLGSPPSFCIFPICDDLRDTDKDCKVPVDPALDDGTVDEPLNDNVDEYGVASYVCYVPGDCTYGSVDVNGDSDDRCPEDFIPPTDDDFEDLNGGWYGRIGNFGVKLNPDDMVCTADTTKTHLTPSREYVTHRYGYGCPDDEVCPPSELIWKVIGNEGINTPYSNQTFIVARKNNKPSIYCPIRALSYPGNLVNEQIKRELSVIPDTSKADDPNVVLPENVCTTGLSCLP